VIGSLLQLQQQQLTQASAEPTTAAAAANSASTSTAPQQQQRQQQQQGVSWSPDLLLSCLKALSQCVEQRLSTPMLVLRSVLRDAPLCPGLTALVDITELPMDGTPSEKMLTQIMLGTWLESDSRHHHESGPSSSDAAEGVPLVLLIGRALHVAARALLQLHKQEAGGAAASAQLSPLQQQSERAPQVMVVVLSALLYFYLAALGPLLEQAAARVAAAGSSSSRSANAAAAQQHISAIKQLQELQQELIEMIWTRAVAMIDSFLGGTDGSTLTTCAAEFRNLLPVSAAQQLLQLATGV
jgi:hypothetical protein